MGTGAKRTVSLRAIIGHPYLDRAVVELYTDRKVGHDAGDLSKDQAADLVDPAALCECTDLIISVDASLVHLASALGRRTRTLLLFFMPDWPYLGWGRFSMVSKFEIIPSIRDWRLRRRVIRLAEICGSDSRRAVDKSLFDPQRLANFSHGLEAQRSFFA